jgi:hypothetical protein
VSLFEGQFDSADGGLQGTRGGSFGYVSILGDVFDQFCLVHKEPLVLNFNEVVLNGSPGLKPLSLQFKRDRKSACFVCVHFLAASMFSLRALTWSLLLCID